MTTQVTTKATTKPMTNNTIQHYVKIVPTKVALLLFLLVNTQVQLQVQSFSTNISPAVINIGSSSSYNRGRRFASSSTSTSASKLCRRNQLTKCKVTSTDITADDYYENNTSSNNSNNVNGKANAKSKVNGDVETESNSKIASYSKLIIFISTTIIIWLSEPLLSLVDTTVVGKFAAAGGAVGAGGVSLQTLQLAALGPATMICDNLFYLVYFLAIAVTNQLASSANQKHSSSIQIKTTSHALGVASILGLMITLLIGSSYGSSILRFIIGDGGAMVNGVDMTTSLLFSSWDYAKIRGLFAPLTVMGMIAQAVCLATLDTKTPALAVVAASVINVVGDILLVAKWKMGLRGAAIATAAAGIGSSSILLYKTKKKMNSWRLNVLLQQERAVEEEEKKKSLNEMSSTTSSSTASTLTAKLPSFVSLPDPKSFISLVKLAGPIFFVLLGKIICYSSMTLKASDFEMMSLATHNIMLRVFFFFCTFGDGFSLAAQSFLPQLLYGQDEVDNDSENGNDSDSDKLKTPTRENKYQAKKLLKRILLLASSMAVINSLLTKTIVQQCGTIFTNDVNILALLKSPRRVFYMAGGVFLHPLIMAFEGSLLATRDLGFLVGSYGVTMAALLSLLQFGTNSFTGVWKALFLFQAMRCTIFGTRVYNKTRVQKEDV
jgi:Na+-driven multidrug efflux pump